MSIQVMQATQAILDEHAKKHVKTETPEKNITQLIANLKELNAFPENTNDLIFLSVLQAQAITFLRLNYLDIENKKTDIAAVQQANAKSEAAFTQAIQDKIKDIKDKDKRDKTLALIEQITDELYHKKLLQAHRKARTALAEKLLEEAGVVLPEKYILHPVADASFSATTITILGCLGYSTFNSFEDIWTAIRRSKLLENLSTAGVQASASIAPGLALTPFSYTLHKSLHEFDALYKQNTTAPSHYIKLATTATNIALATAGLIVCTTAISLAIGIAAGAALGVSAAIFVYFAPAIIASVFAAIAIFDLMRAITRLNELKKAEAILKKQAAQIDITLDENGTPSITSNGMQPDEEKFAEQCEWLLAYQEIQHEKFIAYCKITSDVLNIFLAAATIAVNIVGGPQFSAPLAFFELLLNLGKKLDKQNNFAGSQKIATMGNKISAFCGSLFGHSKNNTPVMSPGPTQPSPSLQSA